MQRGACDGAQNNWDLVLALATDASLPQECAAGSAVPDPGDPGPAAVRRHAAAVMDAVDRNGLVAPWTAVPHLLAMTTDPNGCVQLAHAASCCHFIMEPAEVLSSLLAWPTVTS